MELAAIPAASCEMPAFLLLLLRASRQKDGGCSGRETGSRSGLRGRREEEDGKDDPPVDEVVEGTRSDSASTGRRVESVLLLLDPTLTELFVVGTTVERRRREESPTLDRTRPRAMRDPESSKRRKLVACGSEETQTGPDAADRTCETDGPPIAG